MRIEHIISVLSAFSLAQSADCLMAPLLSAITLVIGMLAVHAKGQGDGEMSVSMFLTADELGALTSRPTIQCAYEIVSRGKVSSYSPTYPTQEVIDALAKQMSRKYTLAEVSEICFRWLLLKSCHCRS